ncbi:hypothetical protein HZS_3332 [Henneguya salminicola]|nr:hypothetical protein HZS_3332 [Henneguya salminicola]
MAANIECMNNCNICLPYIDNEYDDPKIKKRVDELIETEMKINKEFSFKSDEFDENIFLSEIGKNELKRVKNNTKLDSINLKRYEVPVTPEDNKNIGSGLKNLENFGILLQYQNFSLQNLDLLEEFGSQSWRLHNFYLENILSKLKEKYESLK